MQAKRFKISEPEISKALIESIKARDKFVDKYLEKGVKIKGRFYDEVFDFSWHDHKIHLVNPISFDLRNPNEIKKKSQHWFAALNDLSIKENLNLYDFDVLVARPQDQSLFKEYDKALKFIDQAIESLSITEYNEIDRYANEIITAADT